MNIKQLIIILISFIFFQCKKNTNNIFKGGNFSDAGFVFKPCSLINEPQIGWSDSTLTSNKFFFSVVMNPIKKEEFFYIATGKIYSFNSTTNQKQVLCYNVYTSLLEINQFGEILFLNTSGSVCSIKSNGDSLKVLGISAFNPHWDYTGNYIYYSDYVNSVFKLFKYTKQGVLVSINQTLPSPFGFMNYSDRIICYNPTLKRLYLKDIDSGNETTLITNITSSFATLCSDKYDENIYWISAIGLLKLNLTNLKLDTLIKSCPLGTGSPVSNPNTYVVGAYVSSNTDYLSLCYRENIPINSFKKYTICKGLLIDLKTKKITEIKGMP
jgi:hypothetical protein